MTGVQTCALPTNGARASFEAKLAAAHWYEAQRDLYIQRWELRSPPLPLRVDASFPAITPSSLAALGLDLTDIPEIRYQIDVGGREPDATVPPMLTDPISQIRVSEVTASE